MTTGRHVQTTLRTLVRGLGPDCWIDFWASWSLAAGEAKTALGTAPNDRYIGRANTDSWYAG